MLGEEVKIVKNFGSEIEVKEKSSCQGCVGRLESRETSEEDSETEKGDRRFRVYRGGQKMSKVC